MKTFFAMLLLMAASLQVAAQEREGTVIAVFEMKGKPVPIYKFGEVVEQGGDMDAFAAKVAPHLRDYTAREGVEACATICRSPDGARLGATLITIKSAAACPRTTACPRGMKPTEADIHSHPHVTRYEPNAIDKLFLSGTYRRGQEVGTRPDEFSPGDLEGGAGYMASKRLLQYQDGRGHIRRVPE